MRLNKKILIAEDELLIAKVLRMQLEKLGCEVENVTMAGDAVEMAATMKPEIIILDVYLKNKTSGIEAGRQIRETGINSFIVFTTGNSLEITKNHVKDISNCVVLTKPVEFENLLKLITEN